MRPNNYQKLSDSLARALSPYLKGSDQLLGKLMVNWHLLLEEDASLVRPVRVTRAQKQGVTLHVEVSSQHALRLSYRQSVILEKLNLFLGYQAINALKISQYDPVEREIKKAKRQPKEQVTVYETADVMVKAQKENCDPALFAALKKLESAL